MNKVVDLHALANAPGAGKAHQALIAAGYWNEEKAPEATLWVVEFAGKANVAGWVEVRAVDEATARKVADGKIGIADCDIDEIVEWRLTSVEAKPDDKR